ncbi:glycosyl glycerophosphate transferase involved in teichoic acid biosynthesis [Staphylococcus gallinarum]|uniref:Glycosyl glycerophosphate transferase involved in teichoic acid biosynthesis n=1 Tax=Staphylococcus gallinarum TaxID=1293 RepID=A0A380FM05_STAGA|nr:glycosyl glycerophosphate transferase involved in teichoic acid biosynthesis [Staphylococcus gallinarum]
MIKQFELETWDLSEQQLNKSLQEGYTHFVVVNKNIKLYKNMFKAVELKPCTIVADYTVNQQYINDCHYFGKSMINFNDWIENINHYPNVIFHIETSLKLLQQYTITKIFDLALLSLLQEDVATDSHVVFDFKKGFKTSGFCVGNCASF